MFGVSNREHVYFCKYSISNAVHAPKQIDTVSQWNKSVVNSLEQAFYAQMKILLNSINYDLEHIASPCVLYPRLGIRVLSNI